MHAHAYFRICGHVCSACTHILSVINRHSRQFFFEFVHNLGAQEETQLLQQAQQQHKQILYECVDKPNCCAHQLRKHIRYVYGYEDPEERRTTEEIGEGDRREGGMGEREEKKGREDGGEKEEETHKHVNRQHIQLKL